MTGTNTSLAAMYHQCELCANTTVMTFQDSNGFVQVANLTSTGWTTKELNLNSIASTGLALQPFYRAGLMDQVNLYYQRSDLNLSLATFTPASMNGGGELLDIDCSFS